jgi:hypothetical protein
MPNELSKEQLTERAQLIRIHEANCKIEYPSADELNFRLAIMKKLGLTLGLRELRTAAIDGPVAQGALRPGKGKAA